MRKTSPLAAPALTHDYHPPTQSDRPNPRLPPPVGAGARYAMRKTSPLAAPALTHDYHPPTQSDRPNRGDIGAL
ncbi:hypothetical protein [Limnospira platensis]|uniref:hypothetical protein n=1 Tax=Limnospira platensis TaxID=118562 RepID=UPI001260CC54|nr:hypothetical protein [Arthrospira platensis]